MPAFIKTKEDERLWAKAKTQAEKAGHKGDWAYVTGIFKKMKGGKVAADTLAARFVLDKMGAAYPGNLGMMEMVKFFREATPQEKALMTRLLDAGKTRAAWELLKKVTGVALHDRPGLKAASARVEELALRFLLANEGLTGRQAGLPKIYPVEIEEIEDWFERLSPPAKQKLLRDLRLRDLPHWEDVPNFRKVVDYFLKHDRQRAANQRQAKSNAKVLEVPNTFHQVALEPPKATRKEYPFEGFIDFQGIKIDVENAKGSVRRGKGPEGEWETSMFAHYGEIRGTEGVDGDKLDVYVGDNHDSSLVVVIHQHNPWDGKYDEDKVVLGCESVEEAIGLYKKQYDRPGFYREGEHTAMPIGAFWRWVHEERNKGKRVKVASNWVTQAAALAPRIFALATKLGPDARDWALNFANSLKSGGKLLQKRPEQLPRWTSQFKALNWMTRPGSTQALQEIAAIDRRLAADIRSVLDQVARQKTAALKWKQVRDVSTTTLSSAARVAWVRIRSNGQMGATVARRLPNGRWDVQFVTRVEDYNPRNMRGRPKTDAEVIKLFQTQGGYSPTVLNDSEAPGTEDPMVTAKKHWMSFLRGFERYVGSDSRVEQASASDPLGVKLVGKQWVSFDTQVTEDARHGPVLTLVVLKGGSGKIAFQFPTKPLRFPSIEHFLADIVIGFALKHAQNAPAAPATPAAKPALTPDQVTSFLRSMTTRTGGRNRRVEYEPPGGGSRYPFWEADPSRRERLDHYVGGFDFRNRDDDDYDDEGWNTEAWEEEYAGPLRAEVQQKLDSAFGKGLLEVDVGEKGHIEVSTTAKGLRAMGPVGKTALWPQPLWKKGYAEGHPGAVNAAKVVMGKLLAYLRALGWNHLTSHWQIGGDSSYGDHLLFERLYTKVVEETDTLAEKLVGTFGIGAVDAQAQAGAMSHVLSQWDIGCPFERGMTAEKGFQEVLQKALESLEIVGQLSLGMDDFLRTMANDHETHIYLLQQRQGGVKMASVQASTTKQVKQRVGRVAVRSLVALGPMSPEAVVDRVMSVDHRFSAVDEWHGTDITVILKLRTAKPVPKKAIEEWVTRHWADVQRAVKTVRTPPSAKNLRDRGYRDIDEPGYGPTFDEHETPAPGLGWLTAKHVRPRQFEDIDVSQNGQQATVSIYVSHR